MKVKHYNGTTVDVSSSKAVRLVAGGAWSYEVTPSGIVSKPVEVTPQSDDTPEEVSEAVEPSESQEDVSYVATIAEMREWARANNIPNVPSKGKLPRHAVEAYMNAHKE